MRPTQSYKVARAALVAVLLATLYIWTVAASEEAEGAEELPNFGKMRVKELKALLDDRAVECKGCAEKADLVQRAKETYHLPIQEKKAAEPETPKRDPPSQKELEELLEKMGGQFGKDSFKVFNGADFKNMGEEEMRKKFGGDEL